ncbi:hypothetical protein [Spirulina sp. 06S082]|uniref:hypothetical protein n=1 Tax=Spirulina sp. 06S082 TaxID=3110248 RepID=UPI002B204BF7|nr:hypothetical protein [Spirulina sp. 06S082]MEA5469330.1 hypothetical protein [Spirulina sp. 06S082]
MTNASTILVRAVEWLKDRRDKCNTGYVEQDGTVTIARVTQLDGSVLYYGDFGDANGGNTFATDGDNAYRAINSWNFDGVNEIASFNINLPTIAMFLDGAYMQASRLTFGKIEPIPNP